MKIEADDYERYDDFQAIIDGIESIKSDISDKDYMKNYIEDLENIEFECMDEREVFAERIRRQEEKELEWENREYERSQL